MPRISERRVGTAVLNVLADCPDGKASVRKIKQEMPDYIVLSDSGHKDSVTRLREELWEQQVRNLKSHDKTIGNIFHDGLVEIVSRGVWQITPAGRAVIRKKAA